MAQTISAIISLKWSIVTELSVSDGPYCHSRPVLQSPRPKVGPPPSHLPPVTPEQRCTRNKMRRAQSQYECNLVLELRCGGTDIWFEICFCKCGAIREWRWCWPSLLSPVSATASTASEHAFEQRERVSTSDSCLPGPSFTRRNENQLIETLEEPGGNIKRRGMGGLGWGLKVLMVGEEGSGEGVDGGAVFTPQL